MFDTCATELVARGDGYFQDEAECKVFQEEFVNEDGFVMTAIGECDAVQGILGVLQTVQHYVGKVDGGTA